MIGDTNYKEMYLKISAQLSVGGDLSYTEECFVDSVKKYFDPENIKRGQQFIHKGSGKIINAFQDGVSKIKNHDGIPFVNCLYPSGNSYMISWSKLIPVVAEAGDLMQPAVPVPICTVEHSGKIYAHDVEVGDVVTIFTHGNCEYLVSGRAFFGKFSTSKWRHTRNDPWVDGTEVKMYIKDIKKLFKAGEKTMERKYGYDGNGNKVSLNEVCCGSEETKDAWKEFDKDNLKAGKEEVIARRKDHQLKVAAKKYDALSTRLAEVNCCLEKLTTEKTQLEEDLKVFE